MLNGYPPEYAYIIKELIVKFTGLKFFNFIEYFSHMIKMFR